MRDVLLVCPQERDLREIEAAGLERCVRVRPVGPDPDAGGPFDPAAVLAEAEGLPADGVVGTRDRSALLAAIVAERRGLPGPSPRAVIACQEKLRSRVLQAGAAPAAVPRFRLLEPGVLPFDPPFVVKPVVGRLSENVHRVDRPEQLAALQEGAYPSNWAEIAALAGLPAAAVHGFLAEELVEGREITIEGYVHRGRVRVLGATDSVVYPGTGSFECFVHPSSLPPDRLEEAAAVVERVLPALGLDGGFFNVELLVPELGPARIVEVNARIASQFAPLWRATHGRSTYEALLRLACGEDPGFVPAPPRGVAVSYCRRAFANGLVTAVPRPEDGVEVLVQPGLELAAQGVNDAGSYRLAILHAWAPTRDGALAAARRRAAALPFTVEPVASGARAR